MKVSWYYNNHSGEFHNATNPVDNALYASLTHEGIGWHEYATKAQMLASIKAHHWIPPTSSVAKGAENLAPNPLKPITNVLDFLTSPDAWVRMGEVIAGLVLLYAGVTAILQIKPVETAVKAGSKVALL